MYAVTILALKYMIVGISTKVKNTTTVFYEHNPSK